MLCFIERQLPGDSDQSSFGEWLKAVGKRTFGSFDLKGAFWAGCGLSASGKRHPHLNLAIALKIISRSSRTSAPAYPVHRLRQLRHRLARSVSYSMTQAPGP